MTTYTTITNALVAVGAKPFATTIQALRDNPIAIAEGATGAPRIFGEAIARPADGLTVLTVTAADTYTISSGAGITVVSGTATNTTTTNVVAETITVSLFTGAIRFTASHSATGGTTSTLEIYKNNVLVSAFTTTSATLVLRTIDVSIAPADVIQWRHRIASAGQTSTFSSGLERASDAWVTQTAFKRATSP